MPTLEHNALIEMFRENPQLVPHLLATLFHVDVPPYASVAVVESSLDRLIPVEFRADLVLELRDANDTLVLAIVIEVQRDEDRGKKFSWPVYVTVVRAKKRCDTVILVVAPGADVAAWAAENIDLGLGLGHVKPLALGPAVLPQIHRPRRGRERDDARCALGGGARQRAERARRASSGARCPRPARPGARGGLLSDHLERVTRTYAAGSGGVGDGTADRRQGDD